MRPTDLERMQRISRMAIECAREMMAGDRGGARRSASVERLDAGPVRLSLDLMSDRAAAREIGVAIYRALMREVRP
jgi:hypothetical protein